MLKLKSMCTCDLINIKPYNTLIAQKLKSNFMINDAEIIEKGVDKCKVLEYNKFTN